jgi:hypothetical protein
MDFIHDFIVFYVVFIMLELNRIVQNTIPILRTTTKFPSCTVYFWVEWFTITGFKRWCENKLLEDGITDCTMFFDWDESKTHLEISGKNDLMRCRHSLNYILNLAKNSTLFQRSLRLFKKDVQPARLEFHVVYRVPKRFSIYSLTICINSWAICAPFSVVTSCPSRYTGARGSSPVPGSEIPMSACLDSPGPFTTQPITATFMASTPGYLVFQAGMFASRSV